MNKRLFIGIILSAAAVLLSSCGVSKSTVSSSVDLSKYKYGSVINNSTYYIPATLMEYEIQLFDAAEASGLELVSDYHLYDLTAEQKSRMLLIKFGVEQEDAGSVVVVNFIDYITGRPVVSCRGEFGLGLSSRMDLKGAIKRVQEQITETFRRF